MYTRILPFTRPLQELKLNFENEIKIINAIKKEKTNMQELKWKYKYNFVKEIKVQERKK